VFCDLAVMLADGGRWVSDLVALGSQPTLFGEVASLSTARRALMGSGSRTPKPPLTPTYGPSLIMPTPTL
jgi:hypothetical protein